MALTRREIRVKAFQTLYLMEFHDWTVSQAYQQILELEELEKETQPPAYLVDLLEGVCDHQVELDQTLNSHLDHWTVDRMDKVDALILRLGAYELLFNDDVPSQVTIDEMIEIAKTFSNDQSSKLINAVLDSIAKDSQKEGIR